MAESLLALGQSAGLRTGDGFCILTGAFPLQNWRATWQIIDMQSGDSTSGDYSVWDLMAVSSLPSASEKLLDLSLQ